ncbi:MAG: insulinase family protein [Clostridia bacterium]|nr:insulinase family protein [Clostridia bacterium]
MSEIITRVNESVGEKYYYTRHKSGLDIFVIPKKFTESYALFSTRYGAIDNCFKLEGDAEFVKVPDGIAHYLEHKMFENEDGVDTFARFAKYGADANAFTSSEMTAYLFSCTDHFDENLEILLDYVTKPYFTPQTVAKEQGIIGQEIRMGEDNPHRALYYNLMEALYEKHQIKLNVAGTVESIAEITADLLYSCYRTFYNLSNMMLVVSGDVTMEQVLKTADKILPMQEEKKIVRKYEDEKREVNKKRVKASFPVARPLFMIGVKDPDIPADPQERLKKMVAGDMLYSVMFGSTSEFAIDVYESGLVRGFNAGYELDHVYGMGTFSGEADDPEAVYAKLLDYIAEKKKTGLSEADFERCKRASYASLVREFDSVHVANTFTYLRHDDIDVFDYIEAAKNVKFDELKPLLQTLFDEKYFAMSVVEPIEK